MNRKTIFGIGFCTVVLAGCASAPPAFEPDRAPVPALDEKTTAAPQPRAEADRGQISPYACVYKPLNEARGGFYKDDGPQALPDGLDEVLEPVPRVETLHPYANRTYTVLGQTFVPRQRPGNYTGRGIGSWYGRKFHGQKTSSGETYNMFAMTAAHPTLPIPSYAKVTNLKNGRSVVVRINDRGPFLKGREIDLSFLAACRLGYASNGSSDVEVVSLTPGTTSAATTVAVVSRPVVPVVATEAHKLPITAPNLKGSQVYLQLAAFSSRDNADQFVAHVMRELDDDASRLVLQQAGNLYRVRLGPFANRAAALAFADKITGGKKLEAVIAH